MDIYEGEIFGIGGLAGQGKLGIPNGIMGLYDAEGKVELFGQELNFKDTRSVLSAGVAMVSEDRKGVGLLLDRSIEDNIVFNAMQIKGEYLKKFGPFTQIDSKKIRETAEEYIKSLDIRCFGPTQHPVLYPVVTSRRYVLPRRCACLRNSCLFPNIPEVSTSARKSWC